MNYNEILNEDMVMTIEAFNKFSKTIQNVYGKQVGSSKDFKKITVKKLGQVHIVEKDGMSNDKDKKAIESALTKKYPKLKTITWEIK